MLRPKDKKKFDKGLKFYKQGKQLKEIAAELNLHKSTMTAWREEWDRLSSAPLVDAVRVVDTFVKVQVRSKADDSDQLKEAFALIKETLGITKL